MKTNLLRKNYELKVQKYMQILNICRSYIYKYSKQSFSSTCSLCKSCCKMFINVARAVAVKDYCTVSSFGFCNLNNNLIFNSDNGVIRNITILTTLCLDMWFCTSYPQTLNRIVVKFQLTCHKNYKKLDEVWLKF